MAKRQPYRNRDALGFFCADATVGSKHAVDEHFRDVRREFVDIVVQPVACCDDGLDESNATNSSVDHGRSVGRSTRVCHKRHK